MAQGDVRSLHNRVKPRPARFTAEARLGRAELTTPLRGVRENYVMQVTDPTPGLRERKKIRTRQTIRREAFRLIEDNGYDATTVEQIAEAAEVSPSTFFRYFPTKESVLLADDTDPVLLEALAAQPPELSPSQAVLRAYQTTMANLSAEQREFENTRQRLMFSLPELKSAMYDEYYRTITAFAEALGRRTGRDADDFELRVFAGALTGAMMAVYDPGPGAVDTVTRALDFVDAGMPLTGPP
jgi:AcrR family transcriptional regulator